MGADLNNIVRTQKLTDEHVQFLIYQILRGLKVILTILIQHAKQSLLTPHSPPLYVFSARHKGNKL